MNPTKIKICGLTNFDDAQKAASLGADMLGFILYPKSPRVIPLQQAAAIIRQLPNKKQTVAVVVNPQPDELKAIAETGVFDWIQLHGDETPDFCGSLDWMGYKLIKAIRVKDAADIAKAAQYKTDAILLDTFDPANRGGTGKRFDWSLITDRSRKLFLAGGINPDNILEAVATGVYAVDIGSGVESAAGKKDHDKMRRLFDMVHSAAQMKARQE